MRPDAATLRAGWAAIRAWFGLTCFFVGAFVGARWEQPTIARLEETNENLVVIVEQYQCDLLYLEPRIRLAVGDRGFAGWPALDDQLTPREREWCRALDELAPVESPLPMEEWVWEAE